MGSLDFETRLLMLDSITPHHCANPLRLISDTPLTSACAKQIFYNNNNSILEMNAGGEISAFAGKYEKIDFGEF